MPYSNQKKYFEIAYRTGSDIWTNKKYKSKALEYIALIPKGGFILDIGTGRGIWPFTLVELGFKVIGLDYIKELVDINNKEVKSRGLENSMRFLEGDVFDINFEDSSFDVVTDFELIQHIRKEDWDKYRKEINRVLKPGGFILNISLSKDTKSFMGFHPRESVENSYEKDGVFYYFFKDEEIKEVYGRNMKIVRQEKILLEDHNNQVFLISLLQKI